VPALRPGDADHGGDLGDLQQPPGHVRLARHVCGQLADLALEGTQLGGLLAALRTARQVHRYLVLLRAVQFAVDVRG
jgi:hypothetical protein